MARVLIVSTNYDLPTNYISYWLSVLGSQLQGRGHEVSYLRDSQVTKMRLASSLQSKPDCCFFGGHGNTDVFTGINMQPLLIACTNDDLLIGTKAVFDSCLTGINLVPSCVSKGALGASGFTSEFVWLVAGEDPSDDYLAEPFKRITVEPALKFVDTGRFSDWHNEIHRIGNEEISRWNQSNDPLAGQLVLCLRQDMNAATFVSGGSEAPLVGLESPLLPFLVLGGIVLLASKSKSFKL